MSIEQYPPANGVLTSLIWRKTVTGGETSLSGYDNSLQALSYTPGQEQVYLNGILLVRGSDYVATNGTSISGLSPLAANDFIQINCYNNFSVASVTAASISGTISNAQLANSSITINGSAVALGGSATTEFVEKSTLTTTGDLLYASSANTPARIGIGSSGNVLTVSGGVPVWSAPSGGGKVLQVVNAVTSTGVTISSTTYTDTGLSCSITPTSATSKILILVSQPQLVGRDSNNVAGNTRLLRGATALSTHLFDYHSTLGSTDTGLAAMMNITYLDSPSTTSSITYKTQGNVGTTANASTNRYQFGDNVSSMTLLEIGA